MNYKHILLIVSLAAITWFAAANCSQMAAKYENDVVEYESLLAGDSLPVQAKVEHAQLQIEVLSLAMKGNTEAKTETKKEAKCSATAFVDALLATAYKYIGVRYRSGHSDPSGFDCSGFTSFVYRQHNISLTHSSRAQYNEGEHISNVADLQKGDLVFFGGSSRTKKSIGHVGIVTEVNPQTKSFKFIHASTSSGIKVDSSLDPYYTHRYVGACRVVQ